MKRFLLGAALAACLMALSVCASAQEMLRVYVSREALDMQQARRLMQLLEAAFDEADFELLGQAESLRELVLSDRAPNLAICSPREVLPWAREGMIQPLQRRISGQTRIAHEVLSVCTDEETLFMAPLFAKHRQMAVNVRMVEKQGMGYLLDETAHPVWYPTEFQQLIEEFAFEDQTAFDVWLPAQEDGAALEALVQAIYCGRLLCWDEESSAADGKAIASGVQWLRELVRSEMIGLQAGRQEALERFLAGETAIFLDWTRQMQQEYAKQIEESGMTIETRPYPSSSALPVRSYEVMGIGAFLSGHEKQDVLAAQAAAFLNESEEVATVLGGRMIYADDSIWLQDLSADERGATLRSLFAEAVSQVFGEDADVRQALSLVRTGMDAAQ